MYGRAGWGTLKKRGNLLNLGSFNFTKGFLLCLIILGHMSLEYGWERLSWFYPAFVLFGLLKTIPIPLFFLINGYGFKKQRPDSGFRKSVKSLILPYMAVMVVFCLCRFLSSYLTHRDWNYAWSRCLSYLIAFLLGIPETGKVIFGHPVLNCSIIWFFLALFWADNILNLILKQKKIVVQSTLVGCCAILGYVLLRFGFTYYCLPQGMIAVTYCYAGYVIKKTRVISRGLPYKWMYPAWVAIAVVYACWGEFDLCYGNFRFFPLDYIGVIFLSLLVLGVSIYIGQLDWRGLDVIKQVGAYSYWILCIHAVEQKCLPWEVWVEKTSDIPNLSFLATLIFKAALITGFCMLIRKLSRLQYRRKKVNYEKRKLHS